MTKRITKYLSDMLIVIALIDEITVGINNFNFYNSALKHKVLLKYNMQLLERH